MKTIVFVTSTTLSCKSNVFALLCLKLHLTCSEALAKVFLNKSKHRNYILIGLAANHKGNTFPFNKHRPNADFLPESAGLREPFPCHNFRLLLTAR